ncbi:MAG: class I SAM-dependent methyltransferase [Phyllobacterium sp.]|uniref:class I SAM-dependent methyltransferase n=1 Tax=Phyllobacterium sp. TaxID=1871046 RepID=UPI0030F2956B
MAKLPSFKDLERAGWIEKAVSYGSGFGAVTVGAIDPLIDAVQASTGTRLLDVACGPGHGAGRANARGSTAVGVDFAPAMVEIARRNYPDIEFDEGDAEALAFADESFDAVICAFGLLHMAEPEKAIAEAFRVLAPGGRYAFTVWAPPERHQFYEIVFGAINTHGRMDVALPPAPPFFRFSDAAESTRVLEGSGFTRVEVNEIPLVWRYNSPEAIVDMIYKSAVRLVMLLEHQTPEARQRIHAAVVEGASKWQRGSSYQIAVPAVLVSAQKPQP